MTRNRLMQRWNKAALLHIGEKLFTKTLKRKRLANPNHDIHFMARQKDWLEQGVVELINGSYTPRPLKQLIFDDEVVDQLPIADRIFQHMLLKQIKPTFSHIMNPHCYHLHGPTGVKYATQTIRKALENNQPQYMIRADIKLFYASIPHYKLIQDIKDH